MNIRTLVLTGVLAAAPQPMLPAFAQDELGLVGGEAPPANAADEPSESGNVSFEIGGGLEYDSNVALLELDTSANAGDAIASIRFGLGYDMPSAGRFGLAAGYNFSETMHEDFDEFDVRVHRGSGTLSWDYGRTDFGAVLQYARAELDGSAFMTLSQVAPYVSRLVGNKLFLRFAYAGSDKDFDGNPLRAAKADSLSSDVYVFLDGVRTYVLIGLRRDDEDAIDPQFDYAADRFRIQLTRRFSLTSREVTFRIGARSEARDYSGITPSIGEVRRDDRIQLESSAELPLGERLAATIGYQRADNDSNLPAVDFDEDVLSLTFAAEF